MNWDLQGVLYFLLLLLASLTAVLGLISVNHLYKNRAKVDSVFLLVFSLLAFGYSCFALAELSWFLIFDVFKQMPSVSMPDFYWVVGSLLLLLAFVIFSFHIYQRQRDSSSLRFLLIFGAVVLGVVLYLLTSMDLVESGTTGEIFLGYFYPLASSLILIFSLSVYLFFEKINAFRTNLFLFLLANVAFLLGDLLYVRSTIQEAYGLVGMVSDFIYVVAYLLCSFSFFSLLMKTKQTEE